jgi:hypothetical protein
MKLTSHALYEESIDLPTVSDSEYRRLSRNHRKFISQPLTIGMFVPTDLEGNVLSEPKPMDFINGIDSPAYRLSERNYNEAKSRVLFEGFQYDKDGYVYEIGNPKHSGFILDEETMRGLTVEFLAATYNLTLTDNAKKEIGL